MHVIFEHIFKDVFKTAVKHHRLASVENFDFVTETWSFNYFGSKLNMVSLQFLQCAFTYMASPVYEEEEQEEQEGHEHLREQCLRARAAHKAEVT